jgi:hypothetical protein
MQYADGIHQNIEANVNSLVGTTLPSLHHEWPLLGQAFYLLELKLTGTSTAEHQPQNGQKKREQQEVLRSMLIAQVYADQGSYSRDTRHLAFLLLKAGRGGEIVGNPFALTPDDKQQELPYTGLEGYYAGSQLTSEHPGMTAEAILQEEANIGAELLKNLKRRAIEDYSWSNFIHMKHALAQGNPGAEMTRTLQRYWSVIVRRLHVRVYQNPEFELTLLDHIAQVEQEIREMAGRTEEVGEAKKEGEAQLASLKQELTNMSETEQKQQWQETKRRERIRAQKVAAFLRFREDTYRILSASGQGHYEVGIQDTSLEKALIVENVMLPNIPDRTTYPRVSVSFTPEQNEGYLFLAKLGELSGDPLVRSVIALSETPAYV